MGNCEFAGGFHKSGRAFCRADRVVRPYGRVRIRIGVVRFVTLYRAGGVEPRPYGSFGNAVKICRSGRGKPLPCANLEDFTKLPSGAAVAAPEGF